MPAGRAGCPGCARSQQARRDARGLPRSTSPRGAQRVTRGSRQQKCLAPELSTEGSRRGEAAGSRTSPPAAGPAERCCSPYGSVQLHSPVLSRLGASPSRSSRGVGHLPLLDGRRLPLRALRAGRGAAGRQGPGPEGRAPLVQRVGHAVGGRQWPCKQPPGHDLKAEGGARPWGQDALAHHTL